MTKAPAFQLDTTSYLSSAAVQSVTLTEEAMLWRKLIALGENGNEEAIMAHDFIIGFTCRKVFHAREHISLEIRRRVLSRGSCVHCGASDDLQVDHIKPVCRGGKGHISNLQPLCGPCNRKKGGK